VAVTKIIALSGLIMVLLGGGIVGNSPGPSRSIDDNLVSYTYYERDLTLEPGQKV